MSLTLARRGVRAAAVLSLLALLVLPLAAAEAGGGCCFTQVTITSRETGRAAVFTGPALTAGYDLSNFGSFTDFARRVAAPDRTGPSYEVDRDGWDHLLYYPATAGAPAVVFYEGLFHGASEYDGQWFDVPPAQDAALRQVLTAQRLTPAIVRQQWALVLGVFLVAAVALASLYMALGVYTRPTFVRAVAR